MIKRFLFIALCLILFLLPKSAFSAEHETFNNIDANTALKKLIEGNKRFYSSKAIHPDQEREYVLKLTKAQHPFAVVIACSDSRVTPEIIFDQGLGDIFVIRNAGNILDDHVIGSVEYAVKHLGVKLIVVLGHESCGAVTAAVQHVHNEGHIDSIVDSIEPAINLSKCQHGDLIKNSIINNIKLVVDNLETSKPYIIESVKNENLKIIGAYYNLTNEKVKILK